MHGLLLLAWLADAGLLGKIVVQTVLMLYFWLLLFSFVEPCSPGSYGSACIGPVHVSINGILLLL